MPKAMKSFSKPGFTKKNTVTDHVHAKENNISVKTSIATKRKPTTHNPKSKEKPGAKSPAINTSPSDSPMSPMPPPKKKKLKVAAVSEAWSLHKYGKDFVLLGPDGALLRIDWMGTVT